MNPYAAECLAKESLKRVGTWLQGGVGEEDVEAKRVTA